MGKKELILDSSFLMVLTRSRLSENLPVKALLSAYDPVVPEAVVEELNKLSKGKSAKARNAKSALQVAHASRVVESGKGSVDDIILEVAQRRNAVVATLDSELIANLRATEIPVLTLRMNKIVGLGTTV